MGVDEVHHSDSTPSRRHVRALAGNNQQGASVGCASGPDLDGLAPVRDQVRERLPHRQSLQDSAAGDRPLQPLPQFWRNGDRVLVRHGGIVARGRSVDGCTARVGEFLDGAPRISPATPRASPSRTAPWRDYSAAATLRSCPARERKSRLSVPGAGAGRPRRWASSCRSRCSRRRRRRRVPGARSRARVRPGFRRARPQRAGDGMIDA